MKIEDIDCLAAAGRFPFPITDRITVVVLEPVPDVLLVGYFFDGELVRMIEEPLGEA